MALGYEDLTDHDQLRDDPLLAMLSGKSRVGQQPLAGKSTLNRLELGGEAPDEIVLDLDTADLQWNGSCVRSGRSGRRCAPSCEPIRVSAPTSCCDSVRTATCTM